MFPMQKKMGDDTSKHNLLIDSLSSSDSDHIPDLQLIPPERPRRKLRFSRRLPQVAASMNGKAQRLRMNYTNLPSCCLSIVLICIVTGLAVLSWFSLGLQKQIEEMRSLAKNDDGLESSSRSEINESEKPTMIDSKRLEDMDRRIAEFDQKIAQLQKSLSAIEVKTNNSEVSGEDHRSFELTEMVQNLRASINETIQHQLIIINEELSRFKDDQKQLKQNLESTIGQVKTLGNQIAVLTNFSKQNAYANARTENPDDNESEPNEAASHNKSKERNSEESTTSKPSSRRRPHVDPPSLMSTGSASSGKP